MRRFHQDHEGVLPDGAVGALWRCDEAGSTSTLTDFSYSNALHLIKKGAGATEAFVGLFNSGDVGSTSPADISGLAYWFRSEDAFADVGVGQASMVDRAGTVAADLRAIHLSGADMTLSGSITKNGITAISVPDGGQIYLTKASALGTEPNSDQFITASGPGYAFTCFLLAKLAPNTGPPNNSTGHRQIISYGANLFEAALFYTNDNGWAGNGATYVNSSAGLGAPPFGVNLQTGQTRLYTLISNGTTLKLYIDNSTAPAWTTTANVTIPNRATGFIRFMWGGTPQPAAATGIFEMIGVNRAITPGDADWDSAVGYINDHYAMGW